MNLKEEYRLLVKTIKEEAKERGVKVKNTDIAEKLGLNPDYLSTLTGNSGKVTQDHIDHLKLVFQSELAGKGIALSAPGDPMNPYTALLLAIAEDYAEWKAKSTNQSFEDVKASLKQRGSQILAGLDSWLPGKK